MLMSSAVDDGLDEVGDVDVPLGVLLALQQLVHLVVRQPLTWEGRAGLARGQGDEGKRGKGKEKGNRGW